MELNTKTNQGEGKAFYLNQAVGLFKLFNKPFKPPVEKKLYEEGVTNLFSNSFGGGFIDFWEFASFMIINNIPFPEDPKIYLNNFIEGLEFARFNINMPKAVPILEYYLPKVYEKVKKTYIKKHGSFDRHPFEYLFVEV